MDLQILQEIEGEEEKLGLEQKRFRGTSVQRCARLSSAIPTLGLLVWISFRLPAHLLRQCLPEGQKGGRMLIPLLFAECSTP